ncbi:MAG: RING finger protein [Acutalibacteraceae bacterium]|nr:RING finger protein [Acutalibacteraceae bacterium]
MDNFKYENLCCPVCYAKFFEEDDIVVCPVCGAPHHRDCYKHEGHCHYQADHGTENQWEMPKPEPEQPSSQNLKNCRHCSAPMLEDEKICGSCGQSQDENAPNFIPPFYMSGVDLNEKVDDDITAGDVLSFTGPQADRYLRVYKKQLEKNSKISWNWAAFLFPDLWLCSRKMWVLAIPVLIIKTVITALLNVILQPIMQSATNYIDMANSLTSGNLSIILMFYGCLLLIGIFFGLFGDFLYRNHSFKKIRKLKSENNANRTTLLSAGSMNLFNAIFAYFVEQAAASIMLVILQTLNII